MIYEASLELHLSCPDLPFGFDSFVKENARFWWFYEASLELHLSCQDLTFGFDSFVKENARFDYFKRLHLSFTWAAKSLGITSLRPGFEPNCWRITSLRPRFSKDFNIGGGDFNSGTAISGGPTENFNFGGEA